MSQFKFLREVDYCKEEQTKLHKFTQKKEEPSQFGVITLFLIDLANGQLPFQRSQGADIGLSGESFRRGAWDSEERSEMLL
jgi:hypothetical protein